MKIDFPGPVAFDTPSHRQIRHLPYLVHLFHIAMTFSTIYFSCANMLGMTEEYMVGKIMDLNPFNRFLILVMTDYFGYLKCTRPCSVSHNEMAIHANIYRWYSS